ncbi:MAG TPA: hypothetical protein VLA44_08120, partial [Clostridia bacterium]|nr:hypothetical protein [Clostridia bacterium]
EAAETAADLQRVERTAERLRAATVRVARAKALARSDGDPVQALGLVGTEMAPAVDAALAALQAGDLDAARAHADLVITTVEESARAGAARAAGVGIAALLLVVAGTLLWRRHGTLPAVPAGPAASGLPVLLPESEPLPPVRAAVPVTPGSARTRGFAAALAVGTLLLLAAAVLERRRRDGRVQRS